MGKYEDILALINTHGSLRAAAKAEGVHHSTMQERLKKAKRLADLDPYVQERLTNIGHETGAALHSGWIINKDAQGNGESLYFYLGKDGGQSADFLSHLKETIQDTVTATPHRLPPRFETRVGNLLMLDPADVHIGKLSVIAETGAEYNIDIAEHRLVEGCRQLLEKGTHNGATTVCLVIGNDIAHIDHPHRRTTAGTPQDTDGTIFSIHRAAQRAYTRVVEMALEMGLDVHIMFNPSNHDWVLGFTIAQFLGAWFRGHPNVHCSDYSISERHRKYLRFGSNLIGLTHGDGAKEASLGDIMTVEARSHVAEAVHRYWYVHHYHHKIRKMLGVRPQDREKDHVGMTVIGSGIGAMEGDAVAVEYVRSPSATDGWHDRNGYLSRQAVEAFMHHPQDGQCNRFTVWF